MKVLILVSGYPSTEDIYNCAWAHTRSVAYLNSGITPVILNFGAIGSYEYDGVMVYSKNEQENLLAQDFEIVVSHSPNIRNHFPFIKKMNSKVLKKIFLFCHGTESMYVNSDYPKPYSFMKDTFYKRFIRELYDFSKFFLFRSFLKKYSSKVHLVFVSKWMRNMFEKNVMSLSNINYSIINNTISKSFITNSYALTDKRADFITIRRFDESKYAIDLVVKHALNNVDKTYHLYGKGDFFIYNEKPENVKVFNTFISPMDIPELLNHYSCALMPTRCDAQGVMVCEMATYGIPVISTNIEVNQEMLASYDNVLLLDEMSFSSSIPYNSIPSSSQKKNLRFSEDFTVEKEIGLFKEVFDA